MPPVHDIRVPAQNEQPNASDYAFRWLASKSPGIPSRLEFNPGEWADQRVLDFSLGDYWLLARFVAPMAEEHPPIRSGQGSIVNLHNVSFEKDGYTWWIGQPVSPVHIGLGGWLQDVLMARDHTNVHIDLVNEKDPRRAFDLPPTMPGKLYTLLLRIRGDYAQAATGEIDAWASSDPAVPLARALELRDLRILARETINGVAYVQRFAYVWDGGPYILKSTSANAGDKAWSHRHAVTLAGRDLAGCLADEPTIVQNWGSVHKLGYTPDLGDSAATLVELELPAVLLPPELGGSEPVAEPAPVQVSVTEAGVNGAELLRTFDEYGSPFVLTKSGEPIATVARL